MWMPPSVQTPALRPHVRLCPGVRLSDSGPQSGSPAFPVVMRHVVESSGHPQSFTCARFGCQAVQTNWEQTGSLGAEARPIFCSFVFQPGVL